MAESTTLAARPPQYAWMPNLEIVSLPVLRVSGGRDCNSHDEIDKTFHHDDEPCPVHSEGGPAHH
jgi:hypothetical protein